jgi:hypothetical protein
MDIPFIYIKSGILVTKLLEREKGDIKKIYFAK